MENSRCYNCKNYIGGLSCLAFPEEIPNEILLGENPHEQPLKGQENEIVFEEKQSEYDTNVTSIPTTFFNA